MLQSSQQILDLLNDIDTPTVHEHCNEQNVRSRMKWSKEDDDNLIDAVRLHGERWRQIANFLALSCTDDALRNRYNRITCKKSLNIRHNPKGPRIYWTKCEDDMIMSFVAKHGKKWSSVRSTLLNRSNQAIRNRYTRLLYQKKMSTM